MFNWFDLMRQAQTSAAATMLAQHFNLDRNQTERAVAAFLPAFAMGMQHTMGAGPSNPMFQNLWGGAYQNLWVDAAQGFSPRSQKNGKQILDQVFGSDEVSRRVAQQAADMTGVNVEVMQQMLPVLAGIYAGGFYHWLSGHARAAQKAPERQAPDLMEAWSEMCAAWTGGRKAEPTATSPMEAMMAGFLPTPSESAERKAPQGPPAWEEMMEKGRDMQKHYLASLQSIFEEAEKARTGSR